MKRVFVLSLFFLMSVCVGVNAQAPDLDKIISTLKVQYPPVESLDQAAIQLHYFDSIAPSSVEETKLLEAFKALSNGFAANVHYKQGYTVFQKYLTLKEKILARQKAEVISKLQSEYLQKDKSDEDKVVSLQSEVAQLNLDTDGFISKKSGFKNLFSIIIVALSLLFAASLFRSGVRLKNLRTETKANQEKLLENHCLASLGYIAVAIPSTLKASMDALRKLVSEAIGLTGKGNADALKKVLTEIKQKAE